MFRYLLFFALGLYLTLLIGGEDRGQQRAGLRGDYAIDLAQPLPTKPTPTLAAAPAVEAPADTLRILPAAQVATPAPAPEPEPEPALASINLPSITLRTITAEAANVRDAASRTGTVIGRVERGEIVQMVEQTGDWVHIRIEGDGIDGYVHRRLISDKAPSLGDSSLFPAVD